MKFRTKIIISWPIDKVFDALRDPAMMGKVAYPLVFFRPQDPPVFPNRWEAGKTYIVKMYFFGFLPLGWQELKINFNKDDSTAFLTDIGPGFAVKSWNHKVSLKKTNEGETFYDEELDLKAGLLAPMIWIGMNLLFVWRKHRWFSITKKK